MTYGKGVTNFVSDLCVLIYERPHRPVLFVIQIFALLEIYNQGYSNNYTNQKILNFWY